MFPPSWASEVRNMLSLLDQQMHSFSLDLDVACLPPLLARQPPSSRAPAASNLHTAQSTLKELLSSVDILRSHVEKLRLTVSSGLACCANAGAPISALPAEILREIFALAVDGESERRPAITLSHVCRAWREEAFAYSHIWSAISFPIGTACLELYEHHARDSPLHLILRNDERWSCDCSRCSVHGRVLALVPSDALVPQIHRIEVDVNLEPLSEFESSPLGRCLTHLFDGHECNVWELHVHVDKRQHPRTLDVAPRVPTLSLKNWMPTSLCRISSDGVEISSMEKSVLTYMEIDLPMGDGWAQHTVAHTAGCHKLEELHISVADSFDGYEAEYFEQAEGFARLPNLKALSVSCMEADVAVSLLELMEAPNLVKLELWNIRIALHDNTVLMGPLARFPTLTEVVLVGDPTYLKNIVQALGSTKTVASGRIIFPHLRRLVLRATWPSTKWTLRDSSVVTLKSAVRSFCQLYRGDGLSPLKVESPGGIFERDDNS